MEQTECIPEHAATHCSTCDKPFSTDGLSHSLKSDLGGGRCSSFGKPEYAEHVRRNISPLHARNQTNAPLSRSLSPALRSSNLDLETENAKLSEMLARLSVARNATNKLMDDMRNSRRRSLDAKISTGVDRADTPRIPLAKRLALAKAEYAHLENVKRSENQASTILEAHASAEKLDQELLDARKEARAIRTENLIREKEITRMVNYPRDVGAIQEQLQRELAAIRARNANLRKTIEMSRSMRQTKRGLVPSPRARVRLTLSPTHAGDTALDMTVPEHNDDPLPETANDQSSESSETVVVKSSAPEEPEEVVMDATSTIVAELTSPYVEKEENTAVDPVFATLVETTQKRVEMPSPAVSTSPPNLVPVSREVSRGSSTVMLHSSNSNTHWIVSDILRMTTPPANEGDDGHLVEEDVKRPVVVPHFIQQRGEFFDSRVFNIHWVHSPLGTNARLSPCEGDLPGSIYTTPVGETLAIVPVVELGPLATIHEVSPEAGEQSSSVARYTSAHEEIDSDLRRLSDFSSEEATVPSLYGDGIVCDIPNKQSLSSTMFPQASSGDLAMDKVHDTPSTVPIVLDIPDATQTPSAHSTTSYNLPADALDIMAALALEREKTESICGGGIVCDVPNKQSVSSTLLPQTSNGDRAIDKVHDTPFMLPVVPEITEPLEKTDHPGSMASEALDILAAAAAEMDDSDALKDSSLIDLVVDETDLHLRDTVIVDSAPLSPIHQSDQSQSVTLVASAEDSTVVVSCKLCDTTTQILPDTYLSYSYTGESVPETVFELSAMPLNETMRESMPGSASITICEGDYPESDEQLESADPVHSSTILEEPEITAQFESQMISIISVEEIAGTRNASLLMEPVTDRENRQPTNVESELGLPEIQNLSSLNDSVELEHSSEFIPKQLFQSDVVSNETSELGERSNDPTPSPVPHPAPIPVFMKSSLEKSPKFFPH